MNAQVPHIRDDSSEGEEAGAWYERGMALLRDEGADTHEAETCFDRALKIDPHFGGALILKAAFLREAGRHEEAIAHCDRALALEPDRLASLGRGMMASIWRNKSLALHALGRIEEELALYDQMLGGEPPLNERAEIWGLKGAARVASGQIAEALECFREAQWLGNPRAAEGVLICRQHLEKTGAAEATGQDGVAAVTWYRKIVKWIRKGPD